MVKSMEQTRCRCHAIELVGKSRFLSVFNDGLNAICDNLMLMAKNHNDSNTMLYLRGWCPECQSYVGTRVDQAIWSCCTDCVCLYNQTDSNADYEIPTVVNATPGTWSLLGITCYNCGANMESITRNFESTKNSSW